MSFFTECQPDTVPELSDFFKMLVFKSEKIEKSDKSEKKFVQTSVNGLKRGIWTKLLWI